MVLLKDPDTRRRAERGVNFVTKARRDGERAAASFSRATSSYR
jgi:hypothetical protein